MKTPQSEQSPSGYTVPQLGQGFLQPIGRPVGISNPQRWQRGAGPCAALGPKSGKLNCTKPGGVCSLRNFHEPQGTSDLTFGPITATCPNRFLEQGTVIKHVASLLLSTDAPLFAKEPHPVGHDPLDVLSNRKEPSIECLPELRRYTARVLM